MTIRQSAFAFSADAFVQCIEASYAHGGVLGQDRLRTESHAALQRASPKTQSVLEHLRYDPEWFAEGEDAPELWVLVPLAELAVPIPSMSRTYSIGYHVMEETLLALEWDPAEVRQVVYGDVLDGLFTRLPATPGWPFPLPGPFFAGWLTGEACARYLSKLNNLEDALARPVKQVLDAVTEIAEATGVTADALLDATRNDAIASLQTIVDGESDLLLIVD
jgi:hypothetical protein